jgi:hypothetical protein
VINKARSIPTVRLDYPWPTSLSSRPTIVPDKRHCPPDNGIKARCNKPNHNRFLLIKEELLLLVVQMAKNPTKNPTTEATKEKVAKLVRLDLMAPTPNHKNPTTNDNRRGGIR